MRRDGLLRRPPMARGRFAGGWLTAAGSASNCITCPSSPERIKGRVPKATCDVVRLWLDVALSLPALSRARNARLGRHNGVCSQRKRWQGPMEITPPSYAERSGPANSRTGLGAAASSCAHVGVPAPLRPSTTSVRHGAQLRFRARRTRCYASRVGGISRSGTDDDSGSSGRADGMHRIGSGEEEVPTRGWRSWVAQSGRSAMATNAAHVSTAVTGSTNAAFAVPTATPPTAYRSTCATDRSTPRCAMAVPTLRLARGFALTGEAFSGEARYPRPTRLRTGRCRACRRIDALLWPSYLPSRASVRTGRAPAPSVRGLWSSPRRPGLSARARARTAPTEGRATGSARATVPVCGAVRPASCHPRTTGRPTRWRTPRRPTRAAPPAPRACRTGLA